MSRAERSVYLGLGGNVGAVRGRLASALAMIDRKSGCVVNRVSDLYRTPAWGVQLQAPYLNCVAEITTDHSPLRLLRFLQDVEVRHGRKRARKWGPRTLDIDIVLYGTQRVDEPPTLVIPHRHAHERGFVLVPLIEIAPDVRLNGRRATELIRADMSAVFRKLGLSRTWWRSA